jgi:membrane complex biogenesis BtpA family protein
MRAILDRAMRDAQAYAEGGAQAVIVENFGDAPFVKDRVHPHTIAAMTLAVDAVRRTIDLPIGVNVLRNDVLGAVSIAAMTAARFVRANVYTGAAVTDQGLIEGNAEAVQALIRRLDADVQVWADVDVKHAAQLAPRPLGELAMDAIERGLAGAVVVTGRATGSSSSRDDLIDVRSAIGRHPLYVGSGVTVDTIASIVEVADGVIVGTSAKVDGQVGNPVDSSRVRALFQALGKQQERTN